MDVQDNPTLGGMVSGPIHPMHTWGAKGLAPEPMYIVMRWDKYYRKFDDSIFVWKNGKWLTIKCPIPPTHINDYQEIDKFKNELQPFLNSLVFGEAKQAFLIQRDDGRRAIVYRRRRPLYCRIKHLRIVHQDEVIFLRPAQGLDNIEVLWRGQQFDMRLVSDERSLAYLEGYMKGYELLSGLDLTYEVVGLVVGSNEEIIGLLSEPALGRPYQKSDLLALSGVMCTLFDRSLWWHVDVDFGLMMSRDNKVRIMTCYNVRKLRDDDERELWRRELLNQLHRIFLAFPPNGHYRTFFWNIRFRPRHVCQELIDRNAYFLEWPIVMDIGGLLQERFAIGAPNHPLSADQLSHRRGKNSSQLALAATTRIEEIGERRTDADQGESDAQDIAHHLVIHDPKKRCKSSCPYHRSSRKSRKLVLAPE